MARLAPRGALVAALVVASLFGSLLAVSTAPAVDPASQTAASRAVAWIETKQQADGGFEVAGFPGFETPDAVLAIAGAAQTSGTWSAAVALAAVQAVVNGSGKTPLDAVDDFVDGGIGPAEAAKVILLVAAPLGLPVTDFDPSNDSPGAVNLLTTLDPDGCAGNPATYGFFNENAYGALAKTLVCGTPNPAVITTIRNAQRADGGWNYLGSTDEPCDNASVPCSDPDTTSFAMQAIVASGAAWDDPALARARAYLAGAQRPSGAWQSFGADDPNSTAVAMLAIAAAGFDPSSACWRDTTDRSRTGTPYGDPAAWIRSQQTADGNIASPNDAFPPINTFATSQSVHALLLRWLPVTRATGAPTCPPGTETPSTGSSPTAVTIAPAVPTPRFTG